MPVRGHLAGAAIAWRTVPAVSFLIVASRETDLHADAIQRFTRPLEHYGRVCSIFRLHFGQLRFDAGDQALDLRKDFLMIFSPRKKNGQQKLKRQQSTVDLRAKMVGGRVVHRVPSLVSLGFAARSAREMHGLRAGAVTLNSSHGGKYFWSDRRPIKWLDSIMT